MGDERPVPPEEISALFQRLDALIEEARSLQREITERLMATRRRDRQVHSGRPERRRRPRKTS